MNTQRSAGLLLCWLAQSAWGAQHPPASDPSNLADLDLETLMQMDVIVTAQKREERLQNVPISVDAVTGATLENFGDKNFFDYASAIPNLTVGYRCRPGRQWLRLWRVILPGRDNPRLSPATTPPAFI